MSGPERVMCPRCGGSGRVASSDPDEVVPCPRCDEEGTVDAPMRPRDESRADAGAMPDAPELDVPVDVVDAWERIDGKCNARKTDGSGLCRHEAGWRTDHLGFGGCRFHGGLSPSGIVAAQRQRERKVLGPILEEYAGRIGENPDPFEGMLEVVRYGWAWLRMLEARVGELDDEVGTDDQLIGPDHHGDLRPHALVGMLLEARREHRRNCEAAIRAGIAERMVSLAEDQADAMARLIRGVLTDLGHDLEEPETAATVRRHLRALPAAS